LWALASIDRNSEKSLARVVGAAGVLSMAKWRSQPYSRSDYKLQIEANSKLSHFWTEALETWTQQDATAKRSGAGHQSPRVTVNIASLIIFFYCPLYICCNSTFRSSSKEMFESVINKTCPEKVTCTRLHLYPKEKTYRSLLLNSNHISAILCKIRDRWIA
jgi:hypothetical protein